MSKTELKVPHPEFGHVVFTNLTARQLEVFNHLEKTIDDLNRANHEVIRMAAEEKESDSARIEKLEEGIKEMIQVKDWKDKHGKDEIYLIAKPKAWNQLRELVK